MVRAVVFDLWNTLAFWPEEDSRELRRRWAALLEVDAEAIDELWYAPGAYERRESGPIADALASVHTSLGVNGDVAAVLEWRLEVARRALVPIPGVVETLGELRGRGLRLGLISNCTEEVALVWDASPFARLFDVAVFSATAGCLKPDRRIYERMLAELEVPASATLFVGDGANDELEGARRVGMTPVLVRHGEDVPLWDGLEGWEGREITSIPEVLDLVA